MKRWQKPCPECGVLIDRKASGCRAHSPLLRQAYEARRVTSGHKNSGHGQARRLYPELGTCERCEKVPATDRHHIDGNTFNNIPENIAKLCRRCHQDVDGRTEALRARAVSQRKPLPCRICSAMTLGGKRIHGRCRTCMMFFRRNGFERYDENGVKYHRPPAPPKPCVICKQLARPLARGLCHACYEYRRRTGVDRPVAA